MFAKDVLVGEGSQTSLRYALTDGILSDIGDAAEELPVPLVLATCDFIEVLVDIEASHKSRTEFRILYLGITSFLKGMSRRKLDSDTTARLSRTLLMLASKFKSEPGLLPRWFELLQDSERQPSPETLRDGSSPPSSAGQKVTMMPLLHLLLEFSVHENPVGEYARMGIVYMVESLRAQDTSLVRWFVESSGLAATLASGLGAMYSQVSRPSTLGGRHLKGIFRYEDPPILSLAEDSDGDTQTSELKGAETIEARMTAQFRRSLDEFESYLMFWKDLTENCRAPLLKRNLLDHYDVYFVQQLLYPSVAASYTAEREYSHELLNVLRLILDSLEHCALSQLVLCYFLGVRSSVDTLSTSLPKDEAEHNTSQDSLQSSGHTRHGQSTSAEPTVTYDDSKKQARQELLAESGLPVLTLKDILIASLESKHDELRTAALQLLATLIRGYFHYLPRALFDVDVTSRDRLCEFDGLLEIEEYATLAYHSLGSSYTHKELHEEDAEARFEASDLQPVEAFTILPEELERRNHVLFLYAAAGIQPQMVTIRSRDVIMGHIVKLWQSFLNNGVLLNLMLAAFTFEFASCLWCDPHGWVLNGKSEDGDSKPSVGKILEACKAARKDIDDARETYSGAFSLGLRAFEGKLTVGNELSDAQHSSPMEVPSLRFDRVYESDSSASSSPTGSPRRRKSGTTKGPSPGELLSFAADDDHPAEAAAAGVDNPQAIHGFSLGAPPSLQSGVQPRVFANTVLFRETLAHVESLLRVRRFMEKRA